VLKIGRLQERCKEQKKIAGRKRIRMTNNELAAYGELAKGIREILISEADIQRRVSEIGKQITQDYAGRDPLLVGVLKGVLFFMADLLRAITIAVEVDFIAVSSYSAESRERGVVRLVKDLEMPIQGRHVLFIEDVIDTGLTLNYILHNLQARQPASLKVCALFDKREHRLIDIPLRYKGFDLPGRVVVGFGVDHPE
jgi:hypoxanthine phosphoribosyltransferase